MAQNFRHGEILALARRHGQVLVDDLVTHFGVTPQTIRRDLTELCDARKLERVYGGAVLPSGVSNIGYEDRRALNAEAKEQIARLCAAHIPDEASLFLNLGTSTEAVARALLHHRNLMVVTNNMNVAQTLLANESCKVMMVGGAARRSDGGLVGELAVEAASRFKLDFAVIGASAIDADGDLLDFDMREVGVSQVFVRHARRPFLVADHSKFRRSAPIRITSLHEIDTLFCDRPPPDGLRALCAGWQTAIVSDSGTGSSSSEPPVPAD